MSILYPLMALGMFSLAVPIWLHLRRRDESNLVEFSTLRFLDDQPIAKSRPLWPQNWPLLLLRILALLLLIAAFSWPFVEGEETVIVQESRVYILDNTLSHQVDEGFSKAREIIADDLDANDRATQIGVIQWSTTADTLVRFGDDKALAAGMIRELEPSAARGNLIDAFRSAAEMLDNSLGTRRRIILLSDSQLNQWTQRENSPPFLEPEIEVVIPEVSQAARINSSLASPRARRVKRDNQNWIEAAVAVNIQGNPENAVVVFRDRGREVDRRAITFEGDADASVFSKVVVAEWPVDAEQWVLGEASIEGMEGDALSSDNRIVFSLPPLRAGRVELVSDSLFLRRALDPQVMSGRWQVQIADAAQLADRRGPSPPEVLCVDGHDIVASAVREAIRDDLSSGRGVMLMIDQATPVIAGFLREFGMDLQTTPKLSPQPATFRYVYGEHPIFATYRSTEMGSLAEIDFSRYRELKVRDAIPLAFSAVGDPLIFEANVGAGRMLVFAFAFQRNDTNWPIHPTFIPFLDKCLQYLRGVSSTVAGYEPGEAVTWELPPGALADQVFVSLLDPETGRSNPLAVGSLRADVRDREARFQVPSQAGHYAIRYSETGEIETVLDVNASPLESELSYEKEPAAIAAWTREADSRPVDVDDPDGSLAMTEWEALQQPYWWYLLVAAAIAFIAETVCGSVKCESRRSCSA